MAGFPASVARHYWLWLGVAVVAGAASFLALGTMPGLLEYSLGALLILAVVGAWLAAVVSALFRAFRKKRASEVILQWSLIVAALSVFVLALPYILS